MRSAMTRTICWCRTFTSSTPLISRERINEVYLTASLGRISSREFWRELGFKTVKFLRGGLSDDSQADCAIRSFAELPGAVERAFG